MPSDSLFFFQFHFSRSVVYINKVNTSVMKMFSVQNLLKMVMVAQAAGLSTDDVRAKSESWLFSARMRSCSYLNVEFNNGERILLVDYVARAFCKDVMPRVVKNEAFASVLADGQGGRRVDLRLTPEDVDKDEDAVGVVVTASGHYVARLPVVQGYTLGTAITDALRHMRFEVVKASFVAGGDALLRNFVRRVYLYLWCDASDALFRPLTLADAPQKRFLFVATRERPHTECKRYYPEPVQRKLD